MSSSHMSFFFFTILLLLNLVLVSCSFPSHNSSKPHCHDGESLALLGFKYSVDDSDGWMASWEKGTDCCGWKGIKCHPITHHVVGLDLEYGGLSGTIEANNSLFLLRHLHTLNLSWNYFTGEIPPKIGQLSQLTSLDLSWNDFSREIPLEIRRLDLSYNYFTGKVPLEVSRFTQLKSLDLSGNPFAGIFPVEITGVSQLRSLYLSGNNFVGKVPPEIAQLSQLRYLDLSGNSFTGKLPLEFSQLSQLRYLDLSVDYDLEIPNFKMIIDNMTKLEHLELGGLILDTVVPQSITNLSRLSYLDLNSCKLRGELPPNILNLPYLTFLNIGQNDGVYANFKSLNWSSPLEVLDLSSVSFSSTLPSFTDQSQYHNLTSLYLRNCNLYKNVPCWVWNNSRLGELDLSDNNFSASISLNNVLSNLPNLNDLDLSRSGLSVTASDVDATSRSTWPQLRALHLSSCNILELPALLKTQGKLKDLDLSYNKIHGEVPKWLQQLTGLRNLVLSHNYITGGLANLLWGNLYYVDISSNMLEGPLPTVICNSTILGLLDLSNNSLAGDYPHCLGNVRNDLTVLNLGSNRVGGTLPPNFSKCDNLAYLDLSGNRLHGLIPRSLAQCRSLQVLNLRSNRLMDEFPDRLDTLPQIQVLDLSSNLFHGHVPNPKAENPFPMLQILDISRNNFSGTIPAAYIQNFKAMMNANKYTESLQYMATETNDTNPYLFSIVLTVNGVELKYEKVITTLATLDLSNNKFEGEIPNCIGHLVSIHGLNLSHNQLTGPIPPSISNLTLLNSLDLSHNKLTGQIPQELTRLAAMGFLNISENQLVGPIPPGNPFDTFDEYSYKGNPGLCGFPLPKCGDDGRPRLLLPPISETGYSDGDGIFSEWKIMLMGGGCGTVVGLAWGYYMLLVGKPFCLVKLVYMMELAILRFYDNLFGRRRRRRRATMERN